MRIGILHEVHMLVQACAVQKPGWIVQSMRMANGQRDAHAHCRRPMRCTCRCRAILQKVAAKLASVFVVPDGGALISEGAQLAGFTFRRLGKKEGKTQDGHIAYSCSKAGVCWGAETCRNHDHHTCALLQVLASRSDVSKRQQARPMRVISRTAAPRLACAGPLRPAATMFTTSAPCCDRCDTTRRRPVDIRRPQSSGA